MSKYIYPGLQLDQLISPYGHMINNNFRPGILYLEHCVNERLTDEMRGRV